MGGSLSLTRTGGILNASMPQLSSMEDDYFGEDDHCTHHCNASIYYKDLRQFREKKLAQYARCKASVFRHLSIVELSILLLLGRFDILSKHYVDYTGKMTDEDIREMLR